MTRGSRVAVVSTRPETVLEDYARTLRLAGLDLPDESSGDRPRGLAPLRPAGDGIGQACPPWQLDAMRRWLGAGADDVRPTAGRPVVLLGRLWAHPRRGLLGTCAAAAVFHPESDRREDAGSDPAQLLVAWRAMGQPFGAVMDATVCADGPFGAGRRARPVAAHLLLAGRDPVAVDAVAARLAGLRSLPEPLATLAAAGLGEGALDNIDLVGDRPAYSLVLDLEAARHYLAAGPEPRSPAWWRRGRRAGERLLARILPGDRTGAGTAANAWDRLYRDDRRGSLPGNQETRP
jgi:hypothetical protein